MGTSLGLLGILHYHRCREIRFLRTLLIQNDATLEQAALQIDLMNRFITDFIGNHPDEIKPKNLH